MAGAPRVRLHLPRPVAWTAAAGLALTLVYATAYALVRQRDPAAAAAMLRMYGVTILAGREAAMFDALQRGLPAPAVFALSYVDDFGSFLLALPFTWLLLRVLRSRPRVRWAMARFEKQALLRRRFVTRWGLGALALLYFLPGFGAGVPATVVLSVLARIPFRRLLPFFGLATLAVDAAWAAGLAGISSRLPDAAWVDLLPAFVIGAVLALGAVSAWRHRRERHVMLLDFPLGASPGLAAAGYQPQGELTRVDLDRFRAASDPAERRMGVLLQGAEVALVEGAEPRDALRLAQQGVAGLDGLAGLDAGDPRLAFLDPARAAGLVAAARAALDRQVAGWSAPA